jgi:hypothetical protein
MRRDEQQLWFFTRFWGWLGSSHEVRVGSPQVLGPGGSLRSTPATRVLVLAVLMGLPAPSEGRGEHRSALLIHNSKYANRAPRASAEKDIKLVDAVLKKHGFRTALVTDVTKEELYKAVRRFVKTTPINGSGFVYFRGEIVQGKYLDRRETPVLLGIEGNGQGLPLVALMDWMYLHGATARNVIVLDDSGERPGRAGSRGPYGISAADVPANTWLGFAGVANDTAASGNRSMSVFAEELSQSMQMQLGRRLADACGWTKTTCRQPPFSEPASRAVAPPDRFPVTANAGDEWVAFDGSIYCYCPPGAETPGFWIGKYEVPQCKWPIPGYYGGIGLHRNDPTIRQPAKDVHARLASLTSAERSAGRLPADWEYGLPSPAQWEHAARAGSTGDRYFEDAELPRHANFADQSLLDTAQDDYLYADANRNDGTAELAPVGTYLPNAWGIHDVYGNVWELTDTGVLCGGSWVSLPDYCRVTVRKPPLKFPADYVGLRIVIRPVSANPGQKGTR